MNRTKTNFRALRELIGMSQQVLARLMGVDVRSVKRWERGDNPIPDEAWGIVNKFVERQKMVVCTAIDSVTDFKDDIGDPNIISLTYWRSAEEYETAHPGEGELWQMANASSRLIAGILISDDYDVDFEFEGIGEK